MIASPGIGHHEREMCVSATVDRICRRGGRPRRRLYRGRARAKQKSTVDHGPDGWYELLGCAFRGPERSRREDLLDHGRDGEELLDHGGGVRLPSA